MVRPTTPIRPANLAFAANFPRTFNHLQELQRYAPVLINNDDPVNIAGDGGQQINLSKDGTSDR